MAAKHPRLGLNHVTVVPANFEQADDTVDVADETVDADDA
jgi:hypothetical protein